MSTTNQYTEAERELFRRVTTKARETSLRNRALRLRNEVLAILPDATESEIDHGIAVLLAKEMSALARRPRKPKSSC